ncbi:hypothetical protein GS490_13465 [Rhodococcus hoagii]|nr:hypothetical protein [Prescottella equi]
MRQRIFDDSYTLVWDSDQEEFEQGKFERVLRQHAPCFVVRDQGSQRWHLRAFWGATGVQLVDEFEFLNAVAVAPNPLLEVTA